MNYKMGFYVLLTAVVLTASHLAVMHFAFRYGEYCQFMQGAC